MKVQLSIVVPFVLPSLWSPRPGHSYLSEQDLQPSLDVSTLGDTKSTIKLCVLTSNVTLIVTLLKTEEKHVKLTAKRVRTLAPAPTPIPITLLKLREKRKFQVGSYCQDHQIIKSFNQSVWLQDLCWLESCIHDIHLPKVLENHRQSLC